MVLLSVRTENLENTSAFRWQETIVLMSNCVQSVMSMVRAAQVVTWMPSSPELAGT